MARVLLDGVRKAYGDVVAVRDLSLTVADGEFLVLVGPSGCGKSTCLRLIAGLEDLSGGAITIGDRQVNGVSPQDRDIAMVFQNYALYPHMTVYQNLAFGLRNRRRPSGRPLPRTVRAYREPEIRERVDHAAQLLGLEELLRRKPRQLSGGQRQRVALGRAIVREPAVFLMDEPLSNLDAKLRVQTRAELILLHRSLAAEGKSNTTLYVTHDQTEAMTMGDRIAVLNDGALQQVDTPLNLYRHPANKFVAEFIGNPPMNVVGPFRVEADGGLSRGDLRLPPIAGQAERLKARAGGEVLLGIRPEHIADPASSRAGEAGGRLPVAVKVREPLGATVHLSLEGPAGLTLTAVVDADSPAWRDDRFEAVLDLDQAHAFDPQSEVALF